MHVGCTVWPNFLASRLLVDRRFGRICVLPNCLLLGVLVRVSHMLHVECI